MLIIVAFKNYLDKIVVSERYYIFTVFVKGMRP
jgi:hypothetical protein